MNRATFSYTWVSKAYLVSISYKLAEELRLESLYIKTNISLSSNFNKSFLILKVNSSSNSLGSVILSISYSPCIAFSYEFLIL